MELNSICLFSGCGGLSLGLQQAGFNHNFAIEMNEHAFATYNLNLIQGTEYEDRWPTWLECKENNLLNVLKDHKRELKNLRGKIALVSGGPPCQGFSLNGKRDPQDSRNLMVNALLQFVELVQPKIVLIENVKGMLTMRHKSGKFYPDYIKLKLKKLGYDSFDEVVNASDWGVPQHRARYILIGVQTGVNIGANPIDVLKSRRNSFLESIGINRTPVPIKDAICDLTIIHDNTYPDPEFGNRGYKALKYNTNRLKTPYIRLMRGNWRKPAIDTRLPKQSTIVVDRMKHILENCEAGKSISNSVRNDLGIKKRTLIPLNPDDASPTLSTIPDDFIHYSEPRNMTVREMARIQSFPDWFKFCGPYTTGGDRRKFDCPRYTQVGNAVPPLLAMAIGETIISLISR